MVNFVICHQNKPSLNPSVLFVVENVYVEISLLSWKFHHDFQDDWFVNEKVKRVRCCDDNFLLVETEVGMTTVISSLVTDKNCIFTGLEILALGKSGYFIGLYNKVIYPIGSTVQPSRNWDLFPGSRI